MARSHLRKALFLVSPSSKPCGVEAFARELARQWQNIGQEQELLAIDGRPSDWLAVWKALGQVDALAVSLPIVAWKKVLLTPLAALIMALIRGKATLLVLHEWSDLDWRRRAVVGVYALFANRLMFSSPSVRAQFQANPIMARFAFRTSIVPIPSNIEPAMPTAPSPFAQRIRKARDEGKIILGHFGSIYPKKQSDFILDIAVELKRLGRPAFVVFIGSFVKGMDRVEEDFNEKARRLGLCDDILVSGYIEEPGAIYALFQEVDCFAYRFREGLTSRRGSVLACLQSQKLVVVNAPLDAREFDHHRVYSHALANRSLRLVDNDASASSYAALLASSSSFEPQASTAMFERSWRDAAVSMAATLGATAPSDARRPDADSAALPKNNP